MKTTHAPRITALRTGTPGDVIAHASIANRDPLQVDLVAWHAVDDIVGQLRHIYATVAGGRVGTAQTEGRQVKIIGSVSATAHLSPVMYVSLPWNSG